MAELGLIKAIGMALFFAKFYLAIGCFYVVNFVRHAFERLIGSSSKTVICPYKKTHPDVFLTIGTPLTDCRGTSQVGRFHHPAV